MAGTKRNRKRRLYTPQQLARRRERARDYRRRPERREKHLGQKRIAMRSYYQRHRDEVRRRVRGYQLKNREVIAARKHAYYCRNKERISAQQREYARRNAEKTSRAHAEYYRRNRDRIIVYQEIYRLEHPEKRLYWARTHWARRSGAPGKFTPGEFAQLVSRYGQRCAYCGGPGPLTADHRIPLFRKELNPTNDIGNILPACRPCNSSKRTKTEDEFRTWLVTVVRPGRPRRSRPSDQ